MIHIVFQRPDVDVLQKAFELEPALLADRTDLAPDYIKLIVRHGVSVMPPFRKTELSDAELDDVVAYLTRRRR